MLKEKELCYRITGCVYEVCLHLGAGFLESVYQKALVRELKLAGLASECEVPVVGEFFVSEGSGEAGSGLMGYSF